MTEAPQVDLEQQKVSSVDWEKVASGNFFNDDELEPKDLESTEAIKYLRKVLLISSMQMGGMTLVSLLCIYFTILRLLMREKKVFVISLSLTIALAVVMYSKP